MYITVPKHCDTSASKCASIFTEFTTEYDIKREKRIKTYKKTYLKVVLLYMNFCLIRCNHLLRYIFKYKLNCVQLKYGCGIRQSLIPKPLYRIFLTLLDAELLCESNNINCVEYIKHNLLD